MLVAETIGLQCREQGDGSDSEIGEKVYGVHLRTPYQLRSADNLQYPFSNYVRGYTGMLDYVWYDPDRLEAQVSLYNVHFLTFNRRARSRQLSQIYT